MNPRAWVGDGGLGAPPAWVMAARRHFPAPNNFGPDPNGDGGPPSPTVTKEP